MSTRKIESVKDLANSGGSILLALGVIATSTLYSDNVRAAAGASLDSFDASVTAGIPACASGVGTGVAFDGTSLILSCWSSNVLERVRAAAPHDNIGAVTISGLTNGNDMNALAWDAGRNKLWACNGHSQAVLVDTTSGAVDGVQLPISVVGCTDGLAYDGSDDTLWVSPDVSGTVYHYNLAGVLLGSFPVSGLLGGFGNSGIAVGGANMYLANNGGSEIYQTDKLFTSSTLFASFPRRLEDLECDGITFKGLGVGAIWSNDAYDRILNAWEIAPGLCEFGGGEAQKGRMTGGGSVFTKTGARVTHGFELHCDAKALPNSLQVNWGGGNKFHLESLDKAACSDDPNIDSAPPVAGFDTYVGSGTGRYNGVSGATAKWKFTDAGEPGSSDSLSIDVYDASSVLVLSVSGNLKSGNQQAHAK